MEDSNGKGSNSDHSSTNLKLIYEDAADSLQFVRTNIEAVNTRLGVLLGFNAAFVKFSMDLPDQYSCVSLPCISCQWLKALTLVSLVGSIAVTLWGIYPADVRSVLYPKSQLRKSEGATEAVFREAIIKSREERIKAFEDLTKTKANRLKIALTLLGLAASLAALDVIIKLFCC